MILAALEALAGLECRGRKKELAALEALAGLEERDRAAESS